MRKFSTKIALLCAVAVMSVSCLHAAPVDEEEMNQVSAALSKLSSAVHVVVRYQSPPDHLSDADLLHRATAHNQALLDRFQGYVLKARQSSGNSSVLVCDEGGETALIEDAGCTGANDAAIWKTQPGHPCDYVLDLPATCP